MPTSVGRYRIDRVLGSGAFAAVWLGYDDALAAQVAIKVLSGSLLDDLDVRSRFLEEARILRRADSERLVRVHDIGELPDGRPYFVMSYADRGTLADRMRHRPLPVMTALEIAEEIAYGVEVINRLGIIHRDLKPSNVLFQSTPDGGERLLIADLGLAKALAHASGAFTLPVGTPGYMSPEQARFGGGLDVRADVYGLGALTFHMLTGRPPGPAPVQAGPCRLRPELDPEFDRVILRALEKRREDRWPTAAAFAEALRELQQVAASAGPHPQDIDGPTGPPPSAVDEPESHGTPGLPPPLPDPYDDVSVPHQRGQDPTGPPSEDEIVTSQLPLPPSVRGEPAGSDVTIVDAAGVIGELQATRQLNLPGSGDVADLGPPSPGSPGPSPQHIPPHGGIGVPPPGGERPRGALRRFRDSPKRPTLGAIAVILAVVVVGVLWFGRSTGKPAPDRNFVTVSDASGRITVTVPKAWPKQPQSRWQPMEVGLADSRQQPVLRATPDLTGFRAGQGKTPGVFIGMTTDVAPGKLPPPSATRHSHCTASPPENYSRGTLKGTITHFTKCTTGVPSVTEIGLTDSSGTFGVWIRIKQVSGKDLTKPIVDSLRVKRP